LVTSNKARRKHGLPPLTDIAGNAVKFDALRPQKLARPATVYVEQFSAHPLESDSHELYGPPDGYLDADGTFSKERRSKGDRAVYQIELEPEDGYYPLPYMARRASGDAWEGDATDPVASREESRQPFMPDGIRTFDEIDRLGVGPDGLASMISRKATIDFFRIAPSGGYLKGLAAQSISPEAPGRDFFPYRPFHLQTSPPRMTLARITNMTQEILESGAYDGAIWTQGSPRIEETLYWFNLILNISIPVCGNASHRYHGQISNDGPQNIVDSVEYIHSRVWADEQGRDRAGVVLIENQRVYAAREVMKIDARPGGFVVTGGHGGVLGGAGGRGGGSVLRFIPLTRHTARSDVNIRMLPDQTNGVAERGGVISHVPVRLKDEQGRLLENAIPKVSVIKDTSYSEDDYESDPSQHVDIFALLDYKLKRMPLAGFVLEGLNPYGRPAATSCARALSRAILSGFPVVHVGRGNTEGYAWRGGLFIGGSNLTATKARMLLMLCILKLGMLPVARDPANPTKDEIAAAEKKIAAYQEVFDTH
jgi:hypothetical protein